MAAGETLLLDSGPASPIRMISLVALFFAVGSVGLAAILMREDQALGNAVSSAERNVWAVGLVVAMVGFFAAVTLYQRRIATRITLSADEQRLRITSPSLFGQSSQEVAVKELVISHYHDGDKAGEEGFSPPWLRMQVRGSRSYVVPLSGKIPDKKRLLSILSVSR